MELRSPVEREEPYRYLRLRVPRLPVSNRAAVPERFHARPGMFSLRSLRLKNRTSTGRKDLQSANEPATNSPYFACNPSMYETRFVILCCTKP